MTGDGSGPRRRRMALWVTGLGALALLAVLAALDLRIRASGGPGIVPFELAATSERAGDILEQWGQSGRDAARLSLLLDFPYLILYGAFLALAVAAARDAAGRRGWGRVAAAGRWLVAFPVVGAACDALENVGLLVVLGGRGGDAAPALAAGFAIAKFVLTTLALLYLLGVLATLAATARRPA